MKLNTCPCCGYEGLRTRAYKAIQENVLVRGFAPPYVQYFGEPSYEVCDCCGYEFGNDDEPGTGQAQAFEEYLHDWIKDGCVWFSPHARPQDWLLSRQLSGKAMLR